MQLINSNIVVFLVAVVFFTITSMPLSFAQENNNTKGLDDKDVDFATNIEFIKGHLSAAILNKEEGNNELTQMHTFHPINEIYTLIRDKLSKTDIKLNDTLIDSLTNLTSMVYKSTPEEFVKYATQVKNLFDQALMKTIPKNEISDIVFNMSTIINLLKTAQSEYGAGVVNGTIVNIAEYQDANGFVSSAKELLEKVVNSTSQTVEGKFSQIRDALSNLQNSINKNEDVVIISALIDNITNTIPNVLNVQKGDLVILVENNRELPELVDNIRGLLNQSIEKIKSGNYSDAEELAVEAYLDNYEFLEQEVAKHDKKLMEDTEVLLRIQLINQIREKSNIDDLQKTIDTINVKLDEIDKII